MGSYNLLNEKWIKVLDTDGQSREVSLKELIGQAHRFSWFAGEIKHQDAAMMRMTLALCLAVFYRYDENGGESPLRTPRDALARWKTVWDMGAFPEAMFQPYFEKWHDRFFLFDEKLPFYQVGTLNTEKEPSEFGAKKLNGAIFESENKLRSFAQRTGEEKARLTFSEAARWLVFLQSFDDAAVKEKGGLSGTSWPGANEMVFACIGNLFETILLNLVLLRGNGAASYLWDSATPAWEADYRPGGPVVHDFLPSDLAWILTVQSKRVILNHDEQYVTGFRARGGDYIANKVNAFNEPFLMWKKSKDSGNAADQYTPVANINGRYFWQDFGVVFPDQTDLRKPGLIDWIVRLYNSRCLTDANMRYQVRYNAFSLEYGSVSNSIVNYFGSSFTLSLGILEDKNRMWLRKINEEVGNCDQAAEILGWYARDLTIAEGVDSGGLSGKKICSQAANDAKSLFYASLDQPFREWLIGIDTEKDEDYPKEYIRTWRRTANRLAFETASRLADMSGEKALIGRSVRDGKKKTYYSAAICWNRLAAQITKLYGREEKDNG